MSTLELGTCTCPGCPRPLDSQSFADFYTSLCERCRVEGCTAYPNRDTSPEVTHPQTGDQEGERHASGSPGSPNGSPPRP